VGGPLGSKEEAKEKVKYTRKGKSTLEGDMGKLLVKTHQVP